MFCGQLTPLHALLSWNQHRRKIFLKSFVSFEVEQQAMLHRASIFPKAGRRRKPVKVIPVDRSSPHLSESYYKAERIFLNVSIGASHT